MDGVECETKGIAGHMASMNHCIADSGRWEGGRSLDSEFMRSVADNGKGPLAIVRS